MMNGSKIKTNARRTLQGLSQAKPKGVAYQYYGRRQ